jgi:hypothetical protein
VSGEHDPEDVLAGQTKAIRERDGKHIGNEGQLAWLCDGENAVIMSSVTFGADQELHDSSSLGIRKVVGLHRGAIHEAQRYSLDRD